MTDREPPQEIDYAVAHYEFFSHLEVTTQKSYTLRYDTYPEQATYADTIASDFAATIEEQLPELHAELEPFMPTLNQGIKRLAFDFAETETEGTFQGLSLTTLAELLFDLLHEDNMDAGSLVHEVSLLSPLLKGLERSQGRAPFTDPDMRFAHLYGMAKTSGSATGRWAPAEQS